MIRKNKFGVSSVPQRTYNGVVYDSKAEMIHAQRLDFMLRAGEITSWDRQVVVYLGLVFKTKVDFQVFKGDKLWFEEVKNQPLIKKGKWPDVRRHWKIYGPAPLRLIHAYKNFSEWIPWPGDEGDDG